MIVFVVRQPQSYSQNKLGFKNETEKKSQNILEKKKKERKKFM